MARASTGRTAAAVLAAMIGAGFASGREIVRFFSSFGQWSWLGIGLSTVAVGFFLFALCESARKTQAGDLPTLFGHGWGVLGTLSMAVMFTATAGAMLSAMGELTALALPVHNAYTVGVAASLLFAWFSLSKGIAVLAWCGALLIPLCLSLWVCLWGRNMAVERQTVRLSSAIPGLSLFYGAMNVTLAGGLLCEVGKSGTKIDNRRIAITTALLFGGMLAVANAVFLPRMGEMVGRAMPMVWASRELGAPGYWLCLLMLLVAVFSSLVALFRALCSMLHHALPARLVAPAAVCLVLTASKLGFEQLVSTVYPFLGLLGMVLLVLVWGRTRAL